MITTVQSVVTKTAPFDGASLAIDQTVYPTVPDWTLGIEVLDIYGTVRFQFSDSVNAFGTVLAGPVVCVSGRVQNGGYGSKIITVAKKDFPDLRFGVANAVLRLSVTSINNNIASPSVTYRAWLQV